MATNPTKRRISVYYDISEALRGVASTAAQVLVLSPSPPSSSPSSPSSSSAPSSPSPSSSPSLSPSPSPSPSFKRIRRMPHLFDRVVELPIDSEAPVRIEESMAAFTFTASLSYPLFFLPEEVRAEIIEIVPGVTKVSVSGIHLSPLESSPHLLGRNIASDLNHRNNLPNTPLWRFRLPEDSLPQDSFVTCDSHGILVLTVPKKCISSGPSLLKVYQQVREPLSTPPDSAELEFDTNNSVSLHDSQSLIHEKTLDDDELAKPLGDSDESLALNDNPSFGGLQSLNGSNLSDVSQICDGKDLDYESLRNLSEKIKFDALMHTPSEKGFPDESVNSLPAKDFDDESTQSDQVFSNGLALNDETEDVITISTCGPSIEVVMHDESISTMKEVL